MEIVHMLNTQQTLWPGDSNYIILSLYLVLRVVQRPLVEDTRKFFQDPLQNYFFAT